MIKQGQKQTIPITQDYISLVLGIAILFAVMYNNRDKMRSIGINFQ